MQPNRVAFFRSQARSMVSLALGQAKSDDYATSAEVTKNKATLAALFFIHCESDGISSRLVVYIIAKGVYHQP